MSRALTTDAAVRRLRRSFGLLLRALLSLGLLGTLLWWLGVEAVFSSLATASAIWLVPACALVLPQVLISAWRWRLTARRLGLALPMGYACREYYLACFLNQVVPGGVAGDLGRAWRHGGALGSSVAPWHAVFIERASGQLALALLALLGVLMAPPLRWDLIAGRFLPSLSAAIGVGLVAALALFAVRRLWPALGALWVDMRQALFAPAALPLQLLCSVALVMSYVAVYFLCARAIGVTLPASVLLPLIPPVLMAMALPLSVAGWGVREGAAALVWMLAGMPVAEGVAISVMYGMVTFAASLPGAAGLFGARRRRSALDGVAAP